MKCCPVTSVIFIIWFPSHHRRHHHTVWYSACWHGCFIFNQHTHAITWPWSNHYFSPVGGASIITTCPFWDSFRALNHEIALKTMKSHYMNIRMTVVHKRINESIFLEIFMNSRVRWLFRSRWFSSSWSGICQDWTWCLQPRPGQQSPGPDSRNDQITEKVIGSLIYRQLAISRSDRIPQSILLSNITIVKFHKLPGNIYWNIVRLVSTVCIFSMTLITYTYLSNIACPNRVVSWANTVCVHWTGHDPLVLALINDVATPPIVTSSVDIISQMFLFSHDHVILVLNFPMNDLCHDSIGNKLFGFVFSRSDEPIVIGVCGMRSADLDHRIVSDPIVIGSFLESGPGDADHAFPQLNPGPSRHQHMEMYLGCRLGRGPCVHRISWMRLTSQMGVWWSSTFWTECWMLWAPGWTHWASSSNNHSWRLVWRSTVLFWSCAEHLPMNDDAV